MLTVIHRISHAPGPADHARSPLASPALIPDAMPPVQSMLDGKLYDSKSALRKTYRSAGVTEVGNDPALRRKTPKPKPDRKAVRDAVGRAVARAGFCF